jgi:fumarate reductase subunit D
MSEIPPPRVPPATPPPPGGGSYTPPPPPRTTGPSPGTDRTIFLVLSYLGILCLIPLLAKKDDAEVQWHAKNGTVLFLAEIAWVVVRIALAYAGVGCAGSIVGCVVWLGFLALSIVCIVKAVGGQRFRIPFLTDLAEKM